MAWTYSDYDSSTDAATRLSRLRLHIAEVRAVLGPDMSSAAGGVNFTNLTSYLKHLLSERDVLEGRSIGRTFVRGRVT